MIQEMKNETAIAGSFYVPSRNWHHLWSDECSDPAAFWHYRPTVSELDWFDYEYNPAGTLWHDIQAGNAYGR